MLFTNGLFMGDNCVFFLLPFDNNFRVVVLYKVYDFWIAQRKLANTAKSCGLHSTHILYTKEEQ